jgi:hypothetical protein
MEELEDKLKNVILKSVDFVIDGKTIKSGVVTIFNTKQFFIKFKLENCTGVKEYELPYPYRTVESNEGIMFDYCLSAFCPPGDLAYYKLVLCDKTKASKLHNKYLWIVPR